MSPEFRTIFSGGENKRSLSADDKEKLGSLGEKFLVSATVRNYAFAAAVGAVALAIIFGLTVSGPVGIGLAVGAFGLSLTFIAISMIQTKKGKNTLAVWVKKLQEILSSANRTNRKQMIKDAFETIAPSNNLGKLQLLDEILELARELEVEIGEMKKALPKSRAYQVLSTVEKIGKKAESILDRVASGLSMETIGPSLILISIKAEGILNRAADRIRIS